MHEVTMARWIGVAAPQKQAQAGAQRERDDRVVADVAGCGAQNQALLVGRKRGGGEVPHASLRAAQVPSVGEEVKASGFDSL